MRIEELKLYVLGDDANLATMLLPIKKYVLCKDLDDYLDKSSEDSLYTASFLVNSQLIVPESLWSSLQNINLTKDHLVIFPVREATAPLSGGFFPEYNLASWERQPIGNPSEFISPNAIMAFTKVLRHVLSEGWIKAQEYALDYEVVPFLKEGVYKADPSLYDSFNEKEELFDLLQTISDDIQIIEQNGSDYSPMGIVVETIVQQNQEKQAARNISNPQIARPSRKDPSVPDMSGYFRTNSREIRARHKEREEISNLDALEIPDEIVYNLQKRRPRGFTSS